MEEEAGCDEEEGVRGARQLVTTYNAEMCERYKRRVAARAVNINPKRPEETSFSKLDSSLKKIQRL